MLWLLKIGASRVLSRYPALCVLVATALFWGGAGLLLWRG